MAHAEALCAERGERLTPMRRRVLEILAASHKPLGAYEIMDQVARSGPRPAPITVYRALDFLRLNGLVHRIESRNAFVACGRNHGSDALVAFLICERCGAVGEAPAADDRPAARRRRPQRRLHAHPVGDRDHRHLRALPGVREMVTSRTARCAPLPLAPSGGEGWGEGVLSTVSTRYSPSRVTRSPQTLSPRRAGRGSAAAVPRGLDRCAN